MLKLYIVLLFFICFFLAACSENSSPMANALSNSGSNRKELEKVLKYYQSVQDTIGYQSAVFLISNMLDLSTKDPANREAPDLKNISSSYLIKNINSAIYESKIDLENRTLSFNDFCEYVLPHRLSSEKLIEWRADCLLRFKDIRVDREDRAKTVLLVNGILKKKYSFSYETKPIEFQTWRDLIRDLRGDCWTMTTTAIFPLRAFGLPVTIDFAPMWGNINGGSHAWNVLVLSNKSSIKFMGCESSKFNYNPLNIYNQKRIPPKVYRKIYTPSNNFNFDTSENKDNIPPNLLLKGVKDVTDLYVMTKNVIIHTTRLKSYRHGYLCIFSNGQWKPVSLSKVKRDSCVFEKMAVGVLYLPCVYVQGKVKPIGSPFYLSDKQNAPIIFNGNSGYNNHISIETTQSKELEEQQVYSLNRNEQEFYATMDSVKLGMKSSKPEFKKKYSLFYWDNQWIFHSSCVKDSDSLKFYNVPINKVYRLFSDNPTGKERLFSYYDKRQIWW